LALKRLLDCPSIAVCPTVPLANFPPVNLIGQPPLQPPDGGVTFVRQSPVNSSGVLIVIAQEAAEPFATSHRPLPAFFHDPREQQDVRLSLMVPFTMVVCNVLMHRPAQRAFAADGRIDQRTCRSAEQLAHGYGRTFLLHQLVRATSTEPDPEAPRARLST
jgi:hypothetical protein